MIVALTFKCKKKSKDIMRFRDRYFESIKYKVRGNGSEELVLSLETLIEAYGSFESKL